MFHIQCPKLKITNYARKQGQITEIQEKNQTIKCHALKTQTLKLYLKSSYISESKVEKNR